MAGGRAAIRGRDSQVCPDWRHYQTVISSLYWALTARTRGRRLSWWACLPLRPLKSTLLTPPHLYHPGNRSPHFTLSLKTHP